MPKKKTVKAEEEKEESTVAVLEKPAQRVPEKPAEPESGLARALKEVKPDVDKTEEEMIRESREALKHPLPAGQAFFESPEGFIIIGEADKGHMWCRQANKGKGGWINQRR